MNARMSRLLRLCAAVLLVAADCPAFEKIALIDSYDEVRCVDAETREGTEQIVERALGTGATHIFWRNQSGSLPRYPSREDDLTMLQFPLDKRRVGGHSPHGWARLERGETNLIAHAFQSIRAHHASPGIHLTFEENHWANWTMGPWNLEHPQFWCRAHGGVPWPGRSSFAYDEVLEHKMRLVDELIAMGADTIYLDLWRDGNWSPRLEYVPKLVAEYTAMHGRPPPADPKDDSWLQFVSKYTHRYIRALRARCDAAPRKVRLLVSLTHLEPGKEDRHHWERYALDWKALAAEGVFDGIVVSDVNFSKGDPFGSTRRCYEYVRANCGSAALYGHCTMYNYRRGIPSYMKATGLSAAVVARRLLDVAKESGASGVIMEVVDWVNYTPEVMKVIREF